MPPRLPLRKDFPHRCTGPRHRLLHKLPRLLRNRRRHTSRTPPKSRRKSRRKSKQKSKRKFSRKFLHPRRSLSRLRSPKPRRHCHGNRRRRLSPRLLQRLRHNRLRPRQKLLRRRSQCHRLCHLLLRHLLLLYRLRRRPRRYPRLRRSRWPVPYRTPPRQPANRRRNPDHRLWPKTFPCRRRSPQRRRHASLRPARSPSSFRATAPI